MRAFLGEAYEKMAAESGKSSYEDNAKTQYEMGKKEGPLMANRYGHKLCMQKLEMLEDKRNRRKRGRTYNKPLERDA